MLSEDKCRLSPNVQETLCSKVAVDSESSLERRRGLSRRVGKSCKLALTFTNQSPSSPCSQFPVVSHLHPDITPTAQTPSLPVESCFSASTQTQPQDFALLWRIDQKKCSELDSDLSSCGVFLWRETLRVSSQKQVNRSLPASRECRTVFSMRRVLR